MNRALANAGRLLLLLLSLPLVSRAQDRSGELRLSVTDSSGAALPAHGTLLSQASHFELTFDTGPTGEYTVKKLPLGNYRLSLEHPGFALYSSLIEIHSELPLKFSAALTVAAVTQSVNVQDSDTLLDTTNPGNSYQLGAPTLRDWAATVPGRQAIEVVQAQPGWLLEANGVLHPRGSEYDTQFVADGLPILNNRSPAFSPSEDLDDVQTVKTYTSGIPAEFGRKVGGVVETVTDRNPARGLHGTAILGGGSFDTENGFFGTSYYDGRNVFGVSVNAGRTDRFLDPPVAENFTNRATIAGVKGNFERDLTQKDRLRLSLSFDRAGFMVPNELIQQGTQPGEAQRQDRNNKEVSGQLAYQHTFSSSVLGTLQGRVRDSEAGLTSNSFSTPIEAFQDRGFREGYFSGTVAAAFNHHEIKAGVDAIYSFVHEQFSYHITATEICEPSGICQPIFDPSTPIDFAFHESGDDREQAFFIQDNAHFGNLNLAGGIRFDHYSVHVTESAWSPRVGFSWYVPKLGVVFRGSYDRAFGTPAIENLLLSTSAKVRTLNNNVAQLTLQPSRANYYELGATKELLRKAHMSANVFRRSIRNFPDDDVLLDTGISFPIALRSANIYGAESQLAVPEWGPFSAWLNYSYMVASARLPVVGGLFLREDASALLNSNARTWVSQDQRHTAHGQIRYQPWSRFWTSLGASYGTGLPVDLNGESTATLVEQFGQAVVDRVNFSAGRVRPSLAIDLSAAVDLYKKESRALRLQGDIRNLNDRLNLINFASVFSGTAIAPPRTFSLRVRFDY
ncbi:MAG: TonB-dependent receptor [Acidobacteriia bacterium]|nr:TonB-dependent receptor [Terriglobia bacterium]